MNGAGDDGVPARSTMAGGGDLRQEAGIHPEQVPWVDGILPVAGNNTMDLLTIFQHAGNCVGDIITPDITEKIRGQGKNTGTDHKTGGFFRFLNDMSDLSLPQRNNPEIRGAGVLFYQHRVSLVLDLCDRSCIDIVIAGKEKEIFLDF